MIKKLERYIREEDGVKISCPPDNVHIISKINELVDAVNKLQTRSEIGQDKFAEQRKWIGYLCWFWDDDYYLKTAGALEDITTIEEDFHYAKQDTCTVWKHCEPVKPDDDIIFKGGDNG